ncbi:hypothetical protein NE237_008292 [Protea cynaroides]|uniref:KIB1-4 beta-propeller domain-containing protein n=1 Tax=Protea cynaroides TaxID=273540 RepID=A0A9Q0JS64_9MAGN|nr:hypothetical protein NE237_008292 [Protea cynaroides]
MVLFEYNLERGTFGFFSFEDLTVYWINIKGSCESWLVFSSPSLRNYFLLNPFIGVRIDFPYLNRPEVDDFTKVILLSSLINLTTKKIKKLKKKTVPLLGDARWNVTELGHEHFLSSLVYFKNQIYTLSTNGELWIISLSGPKPRAIVCRVRVLISLTIGLVYFTLSSLSLTIVT